MTEDIVLLSYGTLIGVALCYAIYGVRDYIKTDPQIQSIFFRLRNRKKTQTEPYTPTRAVRRAMNRRKS